MEEQISGIVDRITFHNPDNGWSVLKVNVYGEHEPVTVTVNQSKVFAGATMEFKGNWTNHPVYGKQFKAVDALEKKTSGLASYMMTICVISDAWYDRYYHQKEGQKSYGLTRGIRLAIRM